jgi:hypothetical protein
MVELYDYKITTESWEEDDTSQTRNLDSNGDKQRYLQDTIEWTYTLEVREEKVYQRIKDQNVIYKPFEDDFKIAIRWYPKDINSKYFSFWLRNIVDNYPHWSSLRQ